MIELLNKLPSFIYGIQLLIAQLLIIFTLPKKRLWGLFYLAELAVFLPTAFFLPDIVWLGLFYTPSFPLILILLAANVLIFKLEWTKTIFLTVCIAIMQHLAECITMAVRYLFPIEKDSVWWFVISYLCYLIAYSLFFLLFRKHKQEINMKPGKLIVISFTVFFIIYTLRNIAVTLSDTYDVTPYIRAMINGYAAVCCIFCIVFMFASNRADDLSIEKDVMTKLLAQEQARYSRFVEHQDIINRKCHDLKYEIAAMRKLSSEEQKETIEKLEREVMIYENFAKTGNASLDYTLSEKNLYCMQQNIKFTYIVDGDALYFMSATDIYTLFGNAIDNAIECVTRYEDEEKRIISINVAKAGIMLRIHIENYCEEAYEFREGGLPTTKKEKEYHGFGLKSIRFIAEKYGGIMSATCEYNLFLLDIMICSGIGKKHEKTHQTSASYFLRLRAPSADSSRVNINPRRAATLRKTAEIPDRRQKIPSIKGERVFA